MKEAFGILNMTCPKPCILFLDWSNRCVANSEQIVEALWKLHLNNIIIELELIKFVNMTLLDQMKKVRKYMV